MYHLLESKLNVNDYSINDPDIFKIASELYLVLLKSDFKEISAIFPKDFAGLLSDVRSENFDNIKHNTSLNIENVKSFSNASSIVESLDDITNLMRNNHTMIFPMLKMMVLQKIALLAVISFQNKKLTYNSEDVLNFLNKKIQFSQSSIAKEWEIDNDTLSKWFTIVYGRNIFEGRKKIDFKEYLDIFKDLFVKKDDKENNATRFMLQDDELDFYNSIAIKGKTYLKKEIIEEGFDLDSEPTPKHYEQAKNIFESAFPYYNGLNKFPSSLALELISELRKYA